MAVALSDITRAVAEVLIPQAKGDSSDAAGEGLFGSLLMGEDGSSSTPGTVTSLMAGAAVPEEKQEMSAELVLSTDDLNLDQIIGDAKKGLEASQLEVSREDVVPQNVAAVPLLTVNREVLADMLPHTFKLLKSDEELETLDNVILSLQDKDGGELKAAFAQLEALAESSPQTFKEAFRAEDARLDVKIEKSAEISEVKLQSEMQTQKPSLEKTLVALGLKDVAEKAPKTEAQQEILKQARLDVLAEFSDVKGKVFRQDTAKVDNSTITNAILLKGQETKEWTRTLQEDLNLQFEEGAVAEIEARDDKTQQIRDAVAAAQLKSEEESEGVETKATVLPKAEVPTSEITKTAEGQGVGFEPIQLATSAVEMAKPAVSISEQIATRMQDHPSIEKFSLTGSEKISIELKPEALGRVDIRLEMDKNGGVKVFVAADKIESLQALKQEVQTLEKSFNNLGFSSQSQDFQFEHRQHQSRPHVFVGDEGGVSVDSVASHTMPITSYQLISSDRVDVQI